MSVLLGAWYAAIFWALDDAYFWSEPSAALFTGLICGSPIGLLCAPLASMALARKRIRTAATYLFLIVSPAVPIVSYGLSAFDSDGPTIVATIVGVYILSCMLLGRILPDVVFDPRYCARCGYDLTGNESGRCSECGAAISGDNAAT